MTIISSIAQYITIFQSKCNSHTFVEFLFHIDISRMSYRRVSMTIVDKSYGESCFPVRTRLLILPLLMRYWLPRHYLYLGHFDHAILCTCVILSAIFICELKEVARTKDVWFLKNKAPKLKLHCRYLLSVES